MIKNPKSNKLARKFYADWLKQAIQQLPTSKHQQDVLQILPESPPIISMTRKPLIAVKKTVLNKNGNLITEHEKFKFMDEITVAKKPELTQERETQKRESISVSDDYNNTNDIPIVKNYSSRESETKMKLRRVNCTKKLVNCSPTQLKNLIIETNIKLINLGIQTKKIQKKQILRVEHIATTYELIDQEKDSKDIATVLEVLKFTIEDYDPIQVLLHYTRTRNNNLKNWMK